MKGLFRNIILALSDALCVFLAWAFALWGYKAIGIGHYRFGYEFYLRFWPVMVGFVILNAFFRLYHGRFFHPGAQLHPVEELRRLVGSSLIVHALTLAALALTFQTTKEHSRAVIVISGILVAVLSQPMRDFARRVLKALGVGQIPVMLIGDETAVKRVEEIFAENAYAGFKVSDAARNAILCGKIGEMNLTEVFGRYDSVEVLPTDTVLPTCGAQAVNFDGIGGLEIVNQRRIALLRHEKWLVDKFLAAAVFVFSLPLFILIPVLIKLTSKGPVFYRHHRLGKCGRPMKVWKFRSMYMDADERLKKVLETDPERKTEWEAKFKLADDPRVTPLGRFLRKTSLDELPQLFNVFAGEMALVGPRPIVEDEVVRYGASYEIFSSVRPGVTGLWQCSGRSDTGYERRVALDVHYVLNWSPWMDLWILRRTLAVVLTGSGAK